MAESPAGQDGWSFLVARGRRKGYRVLLIPDVLADHNQHGLLAEALSGASGQPGVPRMETLEAAGIGPISCAYRTERLGEADPGGSLGKEMLDEHGRPLEILYGVLCATAGVLYPDAADLDVARATSLATYQRFLADEAGFTPERSHSFALRSTLSPGPATNLDPWPPHEIEQSGHVAQPALPPAALSPPAAAGKGLAMVGLAALGVALAGAAWALLLRSPDGEVVRVQVEAPQPGDLDCGRWEAIRVDAVLATDGAARVAFHWEDPSGDWGSDTQEVVFHRDGSREVHISLPVRIPAGATLRGSISLVVEQPNRVTDTVQYALRCNAS